MKKNIGFILLLVIFLWSCKKPVQYSDIPEIKFISFKKLNATEGEITFSFKDGMGDIGLNDNDTFPPFDKNSPFHYNFLCDYYEKQHGVFVKKDSSEALIPINNNARIPRLSKLPEESIHGEISIVISPSYYDTTSPYNDTILLKFYIMDRKLNASNTEEVIVIR